eukprot:SAG22_NODE_63_length_23302_cov_17.506551_17_plen_124_part_00
MLSELRGNGGGHRRFLQGQGCDVLPDTCPSACPPLFIEFFEGCQDMIDDLTPEEQQEFAGLYADCNELAVTAAAAAVASLLLPALSVSCGAQIGTVGQSLGNWNLDDRMDQIKFLNIWRVHFA